MVLAESLHRCRYRLLATAVLLGGVYSTIVQPMVVQWYRDENYSHGFLVPLIAAFFLYERRKSLLGCPVSPWNPGLAVIVLGVFQLVIGCAASEHFTERSSLIVLLAGLALFLFGKAVFKQILLPLGYLILMVPLPYVVYNAAAFPLKLLMTRVSVAFMHLAGIDVLREGNILIFPSITLEVADACSGIRSLVSLLALAAALAFFIRTSPLKRFLLIIFSIPVALLSNAVRVIVTGILAQYWGAQIAEGFFHEFAGLMVFVLALALLTGIGALLMEKDCEQNIQNAAPPTLPEGAPDISVRRFLLACLLLASAGIFILFHSDLQVSLKHPLTSFPLTVREWRMVTQETFSSEILDVLKPTEYLSRTYSASDGSTVHLYIGYHGGGKDGGEIHSPNHCLPGSGWQEVYSARTWIDSQSGRVNLVDAVYKQGDHTEQFYYWFQVRDRTLTNEYSLKLAEITNSLLHRRRDAAFVRITLPAGYDAERAAAAGERFVKDFYPVIKEYLPN